MAARVPGEHGVIGQIEFVWQMRNAAGMLVPAMEDHDRAVGRVGAGGPVAVEQCYIVMGGKAAFFRGAHVLSSRPFRRGSGPMREAGETLRNDLACEPVQRQPLQEQIRPPRHVTPRRTPCPSHGRPWGNSWSSAGTWAAAAAWNSIRPVLHRGDRVVLGLRDEQRRTVLHRAAFSGDSAVISASVGAPPSNSRNERVWLYGGSMVTTGYSSAAKAGRALIVSAASMAG